MVFAERWEPAPWNKKEQELRKLKDAKNKRERKRKNLRQAEDQQLAKDAEIWINESKEELMDANDDQTHVDQKGRSLTNKNVFSSRTYIHEMFAFHWIRYCLLGMIHVTSKKHDCIETHPAGDIDMVTSTTIPFTSNPPEETSITQSSSSNPLEERSTTTTPFSSNALEEPSTTTLSSSKAALVEVKAEIDTEKCKGTVKIEKKRKKKNKKRNKKTHEPL